MTVAEFREIATNLIHDYDDMDVKAFVTDPTIPYLDKLYAIYGNVGSAVPSMFKSDVKNILQIDTIPSNIETYEV